MTSPKEAFEGIDHFLGKPGRYGLVGFFCSGVILIAVRIGEIKADAFDGNLVEVLKAILIVSILAMIWGVFSGLARLVVKFLVWLDEKRDRRKRDAETRRNLLEIVSRLRPQALFVLWHYMEKPGGKFAAPPIRGTFNDLYYASLIEPDFPAYNPQGPMEGDPFRVRPILYKAKKAVSKLVKQTYNKAPHNTVPMDEVVIQALAGVDPIEHAVAVAAYEKWKDAK